MKFLTTREIIKEADFPLNETTVRRMIHAGKVPGFKNGRTFLINAEAFMEMLDAQSRANVKTQKEESE